MRILELETSSSRYVIYVNLYVPINFLLLSTKAVTGVFVSRIVIQHFYPTLIPYSGFSSQRINLSPFTKDFRGGEQLNESFVISYRPTIVGHTNHQYKV